MASALITIWDREHHARFWEKYRIEGKRAMLQGKYEDADAALSLAVKEAECLGPGDVRLADSLKDLAETNFARHKEQEAEQLFSRALQIYRGSWSARDQRADKSVARGIASCQAGLATVYLSRKKYKDAIPLYREALSIYQRSVVDGAAEVKDDVLMEDCALAIFGLAESYRLLGNKVEAESLHRQLLALASKSPILAELKERIETSYGQLTQAHGEGEDGSNLPEAGSGTSTAAEQNRLWQKYREAGQRAITDHRLSEAETCFTQAVSEASQLGKLQHAIALRELADFQIVQGMVKEAESTYQRGLALAEGAYPAESDNILCSLFRMYQSDADYRSMRSTLYRLLQLRTDHYGANDSRTKQLTIQLARTLSFSAAHSMADGKPREADSFNKAALEVLEKQPDLEPAFFRALNQRVAAIYEREGNHAKARQLYERASGLDAAIKKLPAPAK